MPVGEVVSEPRRHLVHEGQHEPHRRKADEAEDDRENRESEPLETLDHDNSSKRRCEVRTPCPLAQRFQSVVMTFRNNLLELSKEQKTIAHFLILSSYFVRQTSLFIG